MIISEITIKGFKSFGNNEQVLKLNTNSGELILLAGKNGSGKSSLIDSFDYVLFGKVRGKRKKWSTNNSLVNRINREMLNSIKFNSNGVDVEIRRGLEPNVLELIENGVVYDRAGKSNIDDRIIKNYVKMDIETFKSFISMSVNDFKNFMSLSNEEKQLLIDNLFNMDVINKLNEILKDVIKNNKYQIAALESEISTLENSIKSLNETIEKIEIREKKLVERNNEDKKNALLLEIENIKNINSENNNKMVKLKQKLNELNDKRTYYIRKLEEMNKKMMSIEYKIDKINQDILMYENGICPTCKTNLKGVPNYLEIKTTIEEEHNKCVSIKDNLKNNIDKIKNNIDKIDEISKKINEVYNNIHYEIQYNNRKINEILGNIKKMDVVVDINDSIINSIHEINATKNDMEIKKNISSENLSKCKLREYYLKELSNIFSNDGIKKTIIKNIIKPINHFIAENIKYMDINHTVELNDKFDVEIKFNNEIIENDSLSTGEMKKINIAILIAYLKMLRTKKYINVLFLDEVFSSIDEDGVKSILNLLKNFSKEYKINIFVVNHEITNNDIFDKIIYVKKDIFTTINVIDNSMSNFTT